MRTVDAAKRLAGPRRIRRRRTQSPPSGLGPRCPACVAPPRRSGPGSTAALSSGLRMADATSAMHACDARNGQSERLLLGGAGVTPRMSLGWFVDAGVATADLRHATPTSIKEELGPSWPTRVSRRTCGTRSPSAAWPTPPSRRPPGRPGSRCTDSRSTGRAAGSRRCRSRVPRSHHPHRNESPTGESSPTRTAGTSQATWLLAARLRKLGQTGAARIVRARVRQDAAA